MVHFEPFLGLDVASTAAVFLTFLSVHVAAAVVAIVTGIVAMLAHKGPGRHPRVGRWYLGALLMVFATACVLAGFRWPTDLPLVLAGGISVVGGLYGFIFRRLHRRGDVPHILAMGVSYIAMLTAFYVDNGPHLPVWQLLPAWTFWVLPSVVGVPLMVRAVLRRKRLTTAAI
ncbi:DUF2306 domain-containing protein (plasmid) [Leifsonia sp. P73]|uniref:hypothetical protein n=1 Tax=unclassified Leifsonia TaxID=2663824 RepID=UPI003704A56C